MPLDSKKLKSFYAAAQQAGYKKDYNTFVSRMSGNDNYENRKYIYDKVKDAGIDIEDTYEEFMQNMQVKHSSTPKQSQSALPSGDSGFPSPQQENHQQPQPSAPQAQSPYNDEIVARMNEAAGSTLGSLGLPASPKVTSSALKSPRQQHIERDISQSVLKRPSMAQGHLTQDARGNTDWQMQDAPASTDTGVTYTADEDGNPQAHIIGQEGSAIRLSTEEKESKERRDYYKSLDDRISDLDRRIEQGYQDTYGRDVNARRGSYYGITPTAQASRESILSSEAKDYMAAQNLMKTTKRMQEAAQRYKDNPDALVRFAKDTGISFWNSATDFSTWDFGMQSADEAIRVRKLYDKFAAKGEAALTPSERDLLDAVTLNTAAQMTLGDKQGIGNTVGQTSAEMLPFMIEMLVNPASGVSKEASKATAKAIARYAAKRFLQGSMKKGTAKALSVTGKYGSRFLYDIGAGALMSATTSAPHVVADAERRRTGTLYTDENGNRLTDEEGNAGYQGDSAASAYAKAFGARTIENQSELFGDAFLEPLTSKLGKFILRGIESKAGGRYLGKILTSAQSTARRAANTSVGRSIAKFSKGAHYNGMFNEYLEEVVGNFENAATVGDNNFRLTDDKGNISFHEDNSVFNFEDNFATFLAVAVPGIFQSAASHATYQVTRANVSRAVSRSTDAGIDAYDNDFERWLNIMSQVDAIDNSDAESAAQSVKDIISNNAANAKQAYAITHYAQARAMQQAIDMSDEAQEEEEASDLMEAIRDERAKGSEIDNHADAHAASREADQAESSLDNIRGGADIKQQIDDILAAGEQGGTALNAMLNGLTPEQRALAEAYIASQSRINGIEETLLSAIDQKVEDKRAELTPYTSEQGTFAMMDIGGQQRYVKGFSADMTTVYYYDEEGKVQSAPVTEQDINESFSGWQDAEDYLSSYRSEMEEAAYANVNSQLENHPSTVTDLTAGAEYSIPVFRDGEAHMRHYQVISEDPATGSVTVMEMTYKPDAVTNQDGSKSAGWAIAEGASPVTMSKEEAIRRQNEAHDAYDQRQAEQEAGANQQEEEGESAAQPEESAAQSEQDTAPSEQDTASANEQTIAPNEGRDALPSGVSGFPSPQQENQQQSQQPQSALSLIPVDDQGQPIYEQADPDTAWDAILEQTEGDADMAQTIAADMVTEKEAALKKAQSAKPRKGATVAEKIAAQKEHKAAIDRAQSDLDHWKQIAATQQRRQEAEGRVGRSLTKEEADELLSLMEQNAENSTEKELTAETWNETFDENNSIETPIGRVKMGENQITKFFEKNRAKEFGMVGPTLSNPDVIIEEKSEAKDGVSERSSSFLFVKTFNRNGEKINFFASITVKQDGLEVSVSSHYLNKNKVSRAMQEGKILYTREALLPNSSEWRLAEHQANDVPDLLPTQGSNSSASKDTDISSESQENAKKFTADDGKKSLSAQEAAAAAESEAPEWHEDTPQAARARGYRRQGGHTYRRQEPVPSAKGKEVEVKFADNVKQKANVTVMDASTLQPSHMNGKRNISFFIDEAQPKERDGQESTAAAERIASNINPEEITSSVTAYTGAPTVNTRGEVIQGNNRSAALKAMWQNHPEQAEAYKQHLIDHAAEFGLKPEDIESMEQPVLVNMADVEDGRAITLGQYTASDTESGGTERIKAKATAQKMGADMTGFTSRLLRSEDEDETISQLIDANAVETLKWMQRQGYITPTQYRSAFDRKGNLTAEAANDLKSILYETIFQGGSTQLREMFAELPAKAQKAILAIAYRDYDSPASERILPELQRSIIAYHELSHFAPFAKAKGMEELQNAIIMWQRQYQIDESTGESYLPSEKYSNFALQLAAMYKGQTQRLIQSTLSRMLDLIQGKQEQDLFSDSTSDNTPRTLAEAIREVLNIEYNGRKGSNVLGSDDAASPARRQGSPGSDKRDQQGTRSQQPADNTGRAGISDDERGTESGSRKLDNNGRIAERREKILANMGDKYALSTEQANNGELFIQNENGSTTLAIIPDEIFDRIGIKAVPFKLTETMGWHVYDHHKKEANLNSVSDAVDFVLSIINNVDHVRLGRDNTYIFSVEKNRNRLGRRAITIMVNSKTGEFMGIRTSGYETIKKLKERPLLWERGAHAAPEDVATPTITTIKPQQGDKATSRAKSQSNGLSADKNSVTSTNFGKKPVSASSTDIETEPQGKRNGTATPQNGLSSASKDTDISSESQENAKKSTVDDGKKSQSAYSSAKKETVTEGSAKEKIITTEQEPQSPSAQPSGVSDFSSPQSNPDTQTQPRPVSEYEPEEIDAFIGSILREHPLIGDDLQKDDCALEIISWIDEHPDATESEARAEAEKIIDEWNESERASNEKHDREEETMHKEEKEDLQFRTALYQVMSMFNGDKEAADAALSKLLDSLSPERLMEVAKSCLYTVLASKGKHIAEWQATAVERVAHHLKRFGITIKKGRSGLKEGDLIVINGAYASVRSINADSKTVSVLSKDGSAEPYPLSMVKGYVRQTQSAPSPLDRARAMEAERKGKQKQDGLRRRSLREAPASVLPKRVQSILSKIAESFGAEVRYLPTDADSNGLYDPETNTIYLVQDANKALSFVFGHELTHMVKNFSQESYDRLLAAAKQVLGSDFEAFASKKEELYRSHGYNYGRDYYEEEAAADTIGSMIDNGGMAKSILRRLTHPVLTRILDALDHVINLFRGEKAKRAARLRKEIEQAIAAAATSSQRQSDGQTRHAFSGEKGATAADRAESSTVRRENLSTAKTMLSEGKDAKAIKLATGWEMGKDGKWRYEIPDIKYHPKGDAEYKKLRKKQPWSKELDALSDRLLDGEQLAEDEIKRFDELAEEENNFKADFLSREKNRLADWIENKELFDAYPDLKNVEIVFTDQLPKNTGGYYSEKENLLMVNTASGMDTESVIAHEIQHAIQRIEGFATGGNIRSAMEYLSSGTPDSKFADISIKKQVAYELSQKNNLGLTREEVSSLIDNLENDSYPEDKLQQQIDGLCAKHGITEDQLEDIYDMDKVWHEAYRRIAGEVEARNVQTRRRMTEDERRSTLAADTEDVPRHDQIVLRHSLRESDRALRDALIDHMRSFGMDVITDEKEGQRVLDMANREDVRLSTKKRRALETASVSHREKHQPTVVSSADGAKILKELDTAKEKYENLSSQSKTFLGDVAKALGAQRQGSASEYATFETKNGRIVTIRLANHNATVSNFDHRGESDGISIVVSPKKSDGITNDGAAHVVEYYYDAIKLRRADGKPLADIVRSIKQALYSGEFTDTTGLAERQEVNAADVVRLQKAYHGSGADFDRFDHSHMSEGQGAQAYGWGTYVTEVEGIAEGYADMTSRLVLSNGEGSEWMRKRIHDDIISHFNVENGISEIEVSAQGTLNGLDINMDTLPAWQHYFIQHPEDFDPLRSPKDPQSYNFENRKEENAFYESIIASIDAYAESRRSAYMENSVKVKNLYTVDIPDDTGENYLPYDKPLTHAQIETIQKGLARLMESPALPDSLKEKLLRANNGYPPVISIPEGSTGEQAYRYIADEIFDEHASKFLSSLGFTGIKYPANYRSGGNKEGKSNYVIFNEADAKITDRVRFFRTPEGEAYGYTINGKIYIDPRIATSETPIHEYTHLWATALRKQDPSAWKGIVSAMKGTSLWDEVRASYPELETDDDIADEVLAHYSGKRGSARLAAEMSKLKGENRSNPFAKAAAMQAISRMRSALRTFWEKIASLLHLPMERTTDADTIADTVLSDLLGRVDPRAAIEADAINTDSRTSFHKVTDQAELDRLNSEPTQKAYRAMQVIDGKLYPPMAAKVNGKMVESNELGEWIRADENKDLAIADIDKKTGKQKLDKNGEPMWKFKLVKGSKTATGKAGTTVPAAYNPYWHMSRSPLNDQFKSAWIRPNIVIVECEFPASELTSGYKAERAKDAVGEVDWKSGVVSGEVYQQTGRARKVILSRWCKPVRVLSSEEVAEKAKDFIGDAKVVIPENVITPQQRIAFEAAGLTIGEPETGMKKTEQVQEAIKAGLKVDNTLRHSLRDDKSHASPLDRAASMEAERKGKAADKPQSLDEIPSEWKNSKLQASQAVHADSPLEISDEAFTEYTQSVILPRPSEEMEKVLGGNAKPILIKRGIFAKNDLTHGGLTKNGLTPEQSRAILNDALYSGNLVGKTQPATKPDYWVVIRTSKKNKVVVLEVSKSKDFLEVVGWEYRDEQKLQRLYNQARKNRGEIIEIQKEDGGEDGLSLIQNPVRSSAADLSALTPSSDGKGTDILSESQENTKNSSADDGKKSLSAQIEVASPTDGSTADPIARARSMAEESRKRKIESDPAVSHLRTQTDPSAPSERRYSLRGQRMQNPAAAQVSASYDAACASRLFKLDEAWHDYLTSVRHAINEIEKATGKRIPEWANPYMHALIKSSKDSAEYADCTRDYLIPLQEAVQKLMRSSHMTLKDVEFYLMAKHGLERNAVMRKRNAEDAARKKYAPQRMVIEKEHKSGKMSDADYKVEIQALDAQEQADYAANMSDGAKKYHKDYAGFTQMFCADEKERETVTIQELTSRAEAHVKRIEQQCDAALLDDVWQRIKAANDYSLKRTLDSGLISQETYDSIRKMYEHYIPLRGHEDTEASEVYDYFIDNEPVRINSVVKKASGRKSQAGNVLANIMSMCNSAIVQANKNELKQKLYNLASVYPSDLLGVSKVWYVRKYENGQPTEEWIPAHPSESKLAAATTAAERQQVYAEFEQDMRGLKDIDEAREGRSDLDLRYPIDAHLKRQHEVKVSLDGIDYIVYVNGNPRLAQALNGTLNYDAGQGWAMRTWAKIMRFKGKAITSANPDFMISNLQRDIISALTVSDAKYGADYRNRLAKNIDANIPLFSVLSSASKGQQNRSAGIYELYKLYDKHTLDMSDHRQRMFAEFIKNGGETGVSQMFSVQDYQRTIDAYMREGLMSQLKHIAGVIDNGIETANRGIENAVRFAAYCTSRESGKSIADSIYDAKEASVNFNRKGSGHLFNSFARNMYIFLNPAVQGTVQYLELLSKHPQGGTINAVAGMSRRAVRSFVGFSVLGAVLTLANYLLTGGAGDGDDDEIDNDYAQTSSFVRRSNVMIPCGNGLFAKIALAPETRLPYGIGCIAAEYALGMHTSPHWAQDLTLDVAAQIASVMPLDLYDERFAARDSKSDILTNLASGAVKGLIPTQIEPLTDAYLFNEDFAGRKIAWRSDKPYLPEYKYSNDNTSNIAVGASKLLNYATGGDDIRRSPLDTQVLNPAVVEYLVSSYAGAYTEYPRKLYTTIEAAIDSDKEISVRNIPIVNRLLYSVNDKYSSASMTRSLYNEMLVESERAGQQLKALRDDRSLSSSERRMRIRELLSSPEGQVYIVLQGSKLAQAVKDAQALYYNKRADDRALADRAYSLALDMQRRAVAKYLEIHNSKQ